METMSPRNFVLKFSKPGTYVLLGLQNLGAKFSRYILKKNSFLRTIDPGTFVQERFV